MSAIEPYYRSEDGAITVYCARWEDVHAAGLVSVEQVKLVHADPPYGAPRALAANRQGKRSGGGVDCSRLRTRDFPPVHGDDRPFDPGPLLALGRPTVLWGANHYSDRVPGSPSWLFWDKREGVTPDNNADGELAWSNLGGPLRAFSLLWRGTCRASETGVAHLHPTQKPVALSAWVFERAKLRPGDLVFVPYLGSGPDLAAARAMGLRVIACEVEEWCCRTAVSARLRAVPRQEPASAVGPLFSGLS